METPSSRICRGHALYDFQATEDDELSIAAEDPFVLIETYDDDWWLVNLNGRVGVVPSNYLELDDEPTTDPTKRTSPNRETMLPRSHSKSSVTSPTRIDQDIDIEFGHIPLVSESDSPRLPKPDQFIDQLMSSPANNNNDGFYQSTELRRLKSLREQATAKIDALR
jgi:hypothetical protein